MTGFMHLQLKKEGSLSLVVASSGNTGLAVASASQTIGIPCTVFIPENSPLVSSERLRVNGAQVTVHITKIYEALYLLTI
jgi:threonine dehydratase